MVQLYHTGNICSNSLLFKANYTRQRMVLDIIDIRKQFGTKYNKGMLEAIRYAKTLPNSQSEVQ